MKKIVVIGPESTGKSTLCRQLADHYRTEWVPEYARAYLLEHGTSYSFNDLLTVAKGQVALEDQLTLKLQQSKPAATNTGQGNTQETPAVRPDLLFIDTDLYVMKVWCEFVFDRCHSWILEQIPQRPYDLYLLCNTDLPWVKDELREYPDLESRRQLYLIYKDIMINQSVPWVDISGNYDQRLHTAIKAVEKLMGSR